MWNKLFYYLLRFWEKYSPLLRVIAPNHNLSYYELDLFNLSLHLS